jgi:hypothetical protein
VSTVGISNIQRVFAGFVMFSYELKVSRKASIILVPFHHTHLLEDKEAKA